MFIALVGLVAIGIAIGMSLWTERREEPEKAPPAAQSQAPSPAPAKPAETAPSFDIVRINPQGETVIAGRSAPNAQVTILDGGKEIGKVTADGRGEWVFVPDKPLPPGNRELTLRSVNPDGSTKETKSAVLLVVPERSDKKSVPLAVKVNPDGSLEIMQGPAAGGDTGPVSIGGVRIDDQGRLAIAGKATPRSKVQVYLDDRPLGSAEADDQGRWQLSLKTTLPPGDHAIRADQLGADGKVAGRAEIPLGSPGAPPADGKITVERGNSLWRIAKRTYGSGFDYLVIYDANRSQIRHPDRIYPGQVFAIPPARP